MTKLLAKAFQTASQLPENLQDELARQLIDELASEARWERPLTESASKLDAMAEKALGDHHAGLTKEVGFDEL